MAWPLSAFAAFASHANAGSAPQSTITLAQSNAAAKPSKGQISARPASVAAIAAAKSWGYQLRGIEPAAVARSPYDVVVIDFADLERPFTPAEVQVMRTKPDGTRRIVLAYLSIGEAERYRYYWQPAWHTAPPAWLGPENQEWHGNYPVRFWDPAWKAVISGTPDAYLDRIVTAGFDGAYLDRVDVHSVWEKEKPDAEQRMVEFVTTLSAYAKSKNPEFLIVPQNGEELLEHDPYLRAIDAVAKEDLLFGVEHTDEPNAADTVANSLALLRRARQAGKPVMVVEYLCRREAIAKTANRISKEFGFLPYIGPRTLHSLGMADDDYCLPPGPGGRRIALLIGSGAYQQVPPLKAPAKDLKLLAEALRKSGFSEVRERLDLGRDSLSQELQRFAEAAGKADWAVVYYAGLSMRIDNNNYLIPVNARIDKPADVEREAISMEEVEVAVEPAKHVRLVFIDACRPNPFLTPMQERGMSRSAGPGMAAQTSQRSIVLGYSSRCDAPLPVSDSETDIYTSALARHLTTPGLELPWLMERVKDSVLRATKGAQEPAYLGTLPDGAVFFMPPLPATGR